MDDNKKVPDRLPDDASSSLVTRAVPAVKPDSVTGPRSATGAPTSIARTGLDSGPRPPESASGATSDIRASVADWTYRASFLFYLFLILLTTAFFAVSNRYTRIMEDLSYDLRHLILSRFEAPKPSGKVAVVGIDDRTMAELKERWPFNRRQMARAIDRLTEHGAAAVVIDIVHSFKSRYDEGQDKALADAIKRNGHVVLSTYFPFDATTQKPRMPLRSFVRGAAGIGQAIVLDDFWSLTRYIRLYGRKGRRNTMVLEGLRVYWRRKRGWVFRRKGVLHMHLDKGKVVKERVYNGWYDVNLRYISQIPTYSFYDLVSNRVLRGVLKDKIVFIGLTSPLLHDVFNTPVAKDVPGVRIFATATDAILSGASIVRHGWVPRFAMALAALTLSFLFSSFNRQAAGLVCTALTCTAGFLAGLLALHYNHFIEILPLLVGVWPLYALCLGLQSLMSSRKQAQAVQRLVLASRTANIEPNLLHHINQTFGFEFDHSSGTSQNSLPTGWQVLSNFINADYKDIELIGKGGMGLVVRALDQANDRVVAIKVLSPMLLEDENAVLRFQREISVLEKLDHPNIIRILDHSDGDFPYIVMEYLRGESLRARLNRDEYLQHDDFFRIFTGVFKGLIHAHSKGIVHRDLKPENIYITGVSEAKILDFGLAQLSGGTQLTRSGLIMGTFRYMSPEQKGEGEITTISDIYALGVIMLECIIGTQEYVKRFGNYGQQNPNARGLEGPWRSFGPMLDSCLSLSPSDRPRTAEQVFGQLTRLETIYSQRNQKTSRQLI